MNARRDTANPALLGVFLRAHRENTPPSAVGLATVGVRRTPGLRREEVAQLAGVGVAWYTWLEQGRVNASKQVLEAIGRTFRLGTASFRYMLDVGGYGVPESLPEWGRAQHVSSHDDTARGSDGSAAAELLVRDWQHGPALVMNRWLDVVACNDAYRALWGDPTAEPNVMIAIASDRRIDHLLGGRSRSLLRAYLPRFRANTAAHRHVARVAEIYDELDRRAPDLADWWTCQTMDGPDSITVELATDRGTIVVEHTFLELAAGSAGSTVIALHRGLTAHDADALTLLGRVGAGSAGEGMTRHHRIDRDLADAS